MSSFLSSFVNKSIIGKAVLSLLDKFTAACNGFLAVIGILLIVAAPLAGATIPLFSHITLFAVLITSAGTIVGTIICMSAYAKLKDQVIIKTQKELLEAKESSKNEIEQLRRDLDSEKFENNTLRSKLRERNASIISAFEISPINITLKHKIDYDICNYLRDPIGIAKPDSGHWYGKMIPGRFKKETSEEVTVQKEFIGVLKRKGTLYLGTDWDKIKVYIDTDNKKIKIGGSLNNFTINNTEEKDWDFSQIQETKRLKDTALSTDIESKPTEISVIDVDPKSRSLDIKQQALEKTIPNIEKTLCIDALKSELEENAKKHIRAILQPACAILKYEIEFVNSENEISGNTYNNNTYNLTSAISVLNQHTRKELEGAMGEY